MKLSCTKDNLYRVLSITSHLTNKNVNLPVLQNVLIKTSGGNIKLTTTNLEIAINCAVRGKVDEEGETTIPSKLFFDFVSLLPNENVVMETQGDNLNIVCGNHKTKINGLAASEFPLVPSVQGSWSCRVPSEALRNALGRVLFSVATNESRPELTGVCTQFSSSEKGTVLTLAATDSYRLAEAKILLDQEPQGESKDLIIPARTLSEVNRILSVFKDDVDAPAEIVLQVSENQVVFSFGTVEIISRTIEGTYPDYKQIIPKEFQTKAILDKEDFVKSVKAASLFSKSGLFDVSLNFNAQGNNLSVKALDTVRGENTAVCSADTTGLDNSVTVNYRYLLDGLGSIEGDQVMFQMIDASNPCMLTSKDETKGYLYIIMPIKQ
ncbi:MAG: DNA polymerase III subunit beta [Patescibacteria group bacterium]